MKPVPNGLRSLFIKWKVGDENMKKEVKRTYPILESTIKEKLGLVGKIIYIDLWRRLSTSEKEEGVSTDKNVWGFVTMVVTEEE